MTCVVVAGGGGGGSSQMLSLVAASGVGVVVDSRVAGQLIGATEAFGAAGELAGMRLLAGMGTDMASLVFQTMEGPITQRALVGTRQILADFLGGRTTLHQGRKQADRRHGVG